MLLCLRGFPVDWVQPYGSGPDQDFRLSPDLRDRIILNKLIWLFGPVKQQDCLRIGDCDWTHGFGNDGDVRV